MLAYRASWLRYLFLLAQIVISHAFFAAIMSRSRLSFLRLYSIAANSKYTSLSFYKFLSNGTISNQNLEDIRDRSLHHFEFIDAKGGWVTTEFHLSCDSWILVEFINFVRHIDHIWRGIQRAVRCSSIRHFHLSGVPPPIASITSACDPKHW